MTQIKIRNSSGSWVIPKSIKVWNGSAWVERVGKYWNGSAWAPFISKLSVAPLLDGDTIGMGAYQSLVVTNNGYIFNTNFGGNIVRRSSTGALLNSENHGSNGAYGAVTLNGVVHYLRNSGLILGAKVGASFSDFVSKSINVEHLFIANDTTHIYISTRNYDQIEKLSPAGNMISPATVWTHGVTGPLMLDSNNGKLAFLRDSFITVCDSANPSVVIFRTSFGVLGHPTGSVQNHLVIDSGGNVYRFSDSTSSIYKFNATGGHVWTKNLIRPCYDMACCAGGYIYTFEINVGVSAHVIKRNPNGDVVWDIVVSDYGVPSNTTGKLYVDKYTSEGSIYIQSSTGRTLRIDQ